MSAIGFHATDHLNLAWREQKRIVDCPVQNFAVLIREERNLIREEGNLIREEMNQNSTKQNQYMLMPNQISLKGNLSMKCQNQ